MAFLIGCFVCACGKEDSIVDESLVEDTEDVSSTEEIKSAEEEAAEQWEKGYDLPLDEQEREEAETDCKKHTVKSRWNFILTFMKLQIKG